jgi:hypothetical protein
MYRSSEVEPYFHNLTLHVSNANGKDLPAGVNGFMLTHPRVFHETFVLMELKFSAKIVPL